MTELPPELQRALQNRRLLIVWGAVPFELPPRISAPAAGERAAVIDRMKADAARLPVQRIRLSVIPPLPILSLDPTDRVEREFGGRSLAVLLTRQDVLAARSHNLVKLAGDLNSRTGLILSCEEVQHLLEDEDKRYLLDQVRSFTKHDGAVLLVGYEPTSETFKAWWRVIRPVFGTAPLFAAGEFSTTWPDEVTYLGTVSDVIGAILTSVSSGEQEPAPGTTRTGGVTAKSGRDLAPIEVRTLRVDAAVPEQVFVQRLFDLAVAVRQRTSPPLAVKDLKHVESGEVQTTWERGTPLINLRVEVDAPDCEIVGKNSVPFRLIRGTDAPPIYFHLKPLQVGELSIIVTVYQEDYWLGSARVNTNVAEQTAQPAGKVQLTVASQPLWLDCELRILEAIDQRYRVELTLNGEQHFSGRLNADLATWVATGDPAADGQALFNLLLADGELLKAWGEARGRSKQRRLRLRIDPPALRALPWELLRDVDELIAADADTPFSRYLAIGQEWGRALADRPVRVLVVISNPLDLGAKYDLPSVDVELEEQTLREAFSPLSLAVNRPAACRTQAPPEPGGTPGRRTREGKGVGGEGLSLTFLSPPITLARLEAELRHGYHVLHFIGHGGFTVKRQQAALYFENADRIAQRVIDADFAGMLDRLHVPPQLIVLAACQSARQSLHDVFTGLGPQLVQSGVPAVVAMQADVTLLTARQFTATFYRQLLAHGLVDLAMNEARSTLITNGRFDAAVPVLFMRLRDGRLWSEAPRTSAPPIEPPPPIERERLSKEDRASLERQLKDMRESLRLIAERKAQYVREVDIDLQLIREERRLRDKIAELETRLR